MRLLFDQNLSRYLKRHLRDFYPDWSHVWDVELNSTPDPVVWEYAKSHDSVLVTKDSDFMRLSATLGHPPKVIWLRLDNSTTADVAALLRNRYDDVLAFCQDDEISLLVLP